MICLCSNWIIAIIRPLKRFRFFPENVSAFSGLCSVFFPEYGRKNTEKNQGSHHINSCLFSRYIVGIYFLFIWDNNITTQRNWNSWIMNNLICRRMSSKPTFEMSSLLSVENRQRGINKIKEMQSLRPVSSSGGSLRSTAAILVPIVDVEVLSTVKGFPHNYTCRVSTTTCCN